MITYINSHSTLQKFVKDKYMLEKANSAATVNKVKL